MTCQTSKGSTLDKPGIGYGYLDGCCKSRYAPLRGCIVLISLRAVSIPLRGLEETVDARAMRRKSRSVTRECEM